MERLYVILAKNNKAKGLDYDTPSDLSYVPYYIVEAPEHVSWRDYSVEAPEHVILSDLSRERKIREYPFTWKNTIESKALLLTLDRAKEILETVKYIHEKWSSADRTYIDPKCIGIVDVTDRRGSILGKKFGI